MFHRYRRYFKPFVVLSISISLLCLSFVQIKNNVNFSYSSRSESLPDSFLLDIYHSVNVHDQSTLTDELSVLCFDVGLNLNWEQALPQPLFLRAPSINNTALNRIPYRYSSWKSLPSFSRVLTPCEHSLLMRLLIIIEHIFRQHEITFFMAFGTLIGSWRHHDVIPWDGDVDLMISITDKPRFLNILKSLNTSLIQFNILHRTQPLREYYKISFKYSNKAGRFSWRFPFVDIFFYRFNDTHIWLAPPSLTLVKKTNIFPLQMRPFGQLWLPSPRYPQYIIPPNAENICMKTPYNYRRESIAPKYAVKCSQLKRVYPFVSRNTTAFQEVLKNDKSIVHTVIYQ